VLRFEKVKNELSCQPPKNLPLIGLVLIERKLIHKVPASTGAGGHTPNGRGQRDDRKNLASGQIRRRSSKDIGHIAYERAPCVMQAGTENYDSSALSNLPEERRR